MKRNVEKIIESRKNNIPSAYDLSTEDAQILKTAGDGDPFTLMCNSFIYGYEMGVRASKHGHANKRRD